jgi:hypothetical protein
MTHEDALTRFRRERVVSHTAYKVSQFHVITFILALRAPFVIWSLLMVLLEMLLTIILPPRATKLHPGSDCSPSSPPRLSSHSQLH